MLINLVHSNVHRSHISWPCEREMAGWSSVIETDAQHTLLFPSFIKLTHKHTANYQAPCQQESGAKDNPIGHDWLIQSMMQTSWIEVNKYVCTKQPWIRTNASHATNSLFGGGNKPHMLLNYITREASMLITPTVELAVMVYHTKQPPPVCALLYTVLIGDSPEAVSCTISLLSAALFSVSHTATVHEHSCQLRSQA